MSLIKSYRAESHKVVPVWVQNPLFSKFPITKAELVCRSIHQTIDSVHEIPLRYAETATKAKTCRYHPKKVIRLYETLVKVRVVRVYRTRQTLSTQRGENSQFCALFPFVAFVLLRHGERKSNRQYKTLCLKKKTSRF